MRTTLLHSLLALSYLVAPLGAIAALTVLANLARRRPPEPTTRDEMGIEAGVPMSGDSEPD